MKSLAINRAVPYSFYMAAGKSNVGHGIPGQMDVWECINVAESGKDGKPVVRPDNEPRSKPSRAQTVARAVTERLRKEQ